VFDYHNDRAYTLMLALEILNENVETERMVLVWFTNKGYETWTSQTESIELCKAFVSYNVCFYNHVYIYKNIHHFKIPQVIVIATRLLHECGNIMAWCDIEGFSLQNMGRENCLKVNRDSAPANYLYT
jgi:hypothetical protein